MKRRIVAVLASAAALLPLAACAAAAPAAAPAAPAHAPMPADMPADVVATAARLDDLHRRIRGNVEERRAAEKVHYHRGTAALVACMTAAGRAYRPPPFVSHYDEFTDADVGYGNGSGGVMDSLTVRGRGIVLNELAAARAARAGGLIDGTTSLVPDADVPVFNRCNAPNGYQYPTAFEDPSTIRKLFDFPGPAYPPSADLVAAMARYEPCMKQRYGYEADGQDRTEFLYQPRIDHRDAPDGGPANAAWTRGLAEIDAVFAADAACRRTEYEIAMRQLAATIDAWEARHRTKIDAIRADWRQYVADAARLPG